MVTTSSPETSEGKHEVEKILDHKLLFKSNKIKLLIKWKNYSREEASWEEFT